VYLLVEIVDVRCARMGKKSQKRSKKESDATSNTSIKVKVGSNRRSNDQLHRDNTTNPERHNNATTDQSPQILPVKVLNPFYIESSTAAFSNEHYHNYDENDDSGNEEQFGLLEYEDYRNDDNTNCSYDNDLESTTDTNVKSLSFRQKQEQWQRRKQLALEWNIRIGLIVVIMLLVTWLLLSILNSSSGQTTTKKEDMQPQNHSAASPSTSTATIYKPTSHPMAVTTPTATMVVFQKPTTLNGIDPTLSPFHASSSSSHSNITTTAGPVENIIPTLLPTTRSNHTSIP
jgi:hypothetical protein